MGAIWKYYLDSTGFNLGFSVLVGLFFGILWGLITFASFGTLIGLISFSYFKKKEYYFYYNLGYTKRNLMLKTWMINILIVVPFISVYLLITSLI